MTDEGKVPYEFKLAPVDMSLKRAFCAECGEELLSSGIVMTGNPPKYPHACKNGHTVVFGNVFPVLAYKERDGAGGGTA